MEEKINIEDEPIGKMAYGDLECPAFFMVQEERDGPIHKIKLISETFLTVRIRKFMLNGTREGVKHTDYYKLKTDTVNVIEELTEREFIIEGLDEEE